MRVITPVSHKHKPSAWINQTYDASLQLRWSIHNRVLLCVVCCVAVWWHQNLPITVLCWSAFEHIAVNYKMYHAQNISIGENWVMMLKCDDQHLFPPDQVHRRTCLHELLCKTNINERGNKYVRYSRKCKSKHSNNNIIKKQHRYCRDVYWS